MPLRGGAPTDPLWGHVAHLHATHVVNAIQEASRCCNAYLTASQPAHVHMPFPDTLRQSSHVQGKLRVLVLP